ncbi:HD domain-containing protein [Amnibacterium kyonggiense]
MSTDDRDRDRIRPIDGRGDAVGGRSPRNGDDGSSALPRVTSLVALREPVGTADPETQRPAVELLDHGRGPAPDAAEQVGPGGPAPSRRARAARLLAGELLARLGDEEQRWHHTQAVAARAAQAAHLFRPEEADVLVAAAWLHDVGYAPRLDRHGFHPVDGAEHVRTRLGWPAVAGLIAQHSGARFVARVRGLGHLMRPFADSRFWSGPVADALTWADQTIAPDGRPVTVEERIEEMLRRHGPESPNARSNGERAPALIAAVRETERRLALPRG